MKVAIVDDELPMREQLTEYVTRFAQEEALSAQVIPFPSGDALLAEYEPVYDVVIFDIDMPGTNGIEAARRVRSRDENVVILFVTNIAQYAINGYEVEAVDYIIKPIGYYEFAMKFRRAVRRVKRRQSSQLVIDSTEGPVRIDVGEVLYVEVLAHYLIYHTRHREYRVRGTMKEHEAELCAHHFSRAHKSYLINLAHVENINAAGVTVGGQQLPLGRAYKDALMGDYMRYLRG